MEQRKQRYSEGSITIYFSLSLLLLSSLFFSMTETLRIFAMKLESRVITAEALASGFSEYQRWLWEQYGVLGLDFSYGEEEANIGRLEQRLADFAWDNTVYEEELSGGRRKNFLHIQPVDCQIASYRVLTDEDGIPFMLQGAKAVKQQLPQTILKQLQQETGQIGSQSNEEFDLDACVTAGENALASAEETEKEGGINGQENGQTQTAEQKPENTQTQETGYEVEDAENPFTVFRNIKKQGLLGLVTTGQEVSSKAIEKSSVVSRRTLEKGTESKKDEVTPVDRFCYIQYLRNHFGLYTNQKEDGSLDYELEYILAGRDNDRGNLEAAAGRILAIRELENIATIASSGAMMQQSYQVALSLAGASANGGIIMAVQLAVIAVWALVESILDLRTLLQGGKVAFLKTEADWTSDIRHLGHCLLGQEKARECREGLSYGSYLAALLLLLENRELGLRPQDLIEMRLKNREDSFCCRMDQMICEATVYMSYQGRPLFFSYMGEGLPSMKMYEYEWQQSICY